MLNLARRRTLVHELSCIENLARVDVLCLDKTGTLTEGSMEVLKALPLAQGLDGPGWRRCWAALCTAAATTTPPPAR